MPEPIDYGTHAAAIDYGAHDGAAEHQSAGDFMKEKAGEFFGNLWNKLNPAPLIHAISSALPSNLGGTGQYDIAPIVDLGKAIVDSHVKEFKRAANEWKAGKPSAAITSGIYGAIPVVGPAWDAAAEQIAKGDVAGGVGSMIGIAGPALLGDEAVQGALSKIPGVVADTAKAAAQGTANLAGKIPDVAGGASDVLGLLSPRAGHALSLIQRLKKGIAGPIKEPQVSGPKIMQAEAVPAERPTWRQDVVDELNRTPVQGNMGIQDLAAAPPAVASPPALVPRAINNRLGVADRIADHLHNAGITSADLAKLEGDGAKLFWDQTGTIPGISKQTHYSPSPATIEAAKSALLKREKLGIPTIESAKQPISANLRGNPAALRIAEQLQQEMLRP